MEFLARFLSWLFLPLLTPIYALLIVFYVPAQPKTFYIFDALYYYPPEAKYLYLMLFFVFAVMAPGLSLIVLRFNNSISSLSLENREERGTPILIMVFYTAVLYLFLIFQGDNTLVPNVIKGMALGGLLASAMSYVINKSFKVSLHGIGIGSLIGFVYTYFLTMEEFSLWSLTAVIFTGGLVLSARLFLRMHNFSQIIVGASIGFASQFFCVYFYP